jgi:hypothetical protein
MALGEGKFDEGGARNRRGQQAASQPSKRLNRVYNCIESLSEQSKAALNGVILSSASWFDEKNEKKKKKKNNSADGSRGISLEECDERRQRSARSEVKLANEGRQEGVKRK